MFQAAELLSTLIIQNISGAQSFLKDHHTKHYSNDVESSARCR